ncbi:unnamed protein product [Dovyalis caffra]|uniref:Uncharacterized protein n=1 Tax=Dovyalis caffra TaxID=77055 RepID=A0AAV1SJQ3_9ROSI|nr:unnamed protein product [Dovyalis caffra]
MSPPQSLSLFSFPSVSPPPRPFSSKSKPTIKFPTFFFTKLPLTIPKFPLHVLHCTSPKPSQQEQLLQFVADSNGNTLPCVRTFENNLARLSLVGSVRFDQALTAGAADGGRAASEHLNSGVPAMVVDTVFPAPADEHATVSTRLFLPATKVKQKAAKLRRFFKEGVMAGTTSQKILAMTFRQVVLQQLWNFELVLFRPGTERNMSDLENPREVPFDTDGFSSLMHFVSAEAVCIAALQNTERRFVDDLLGKSSGGFLSWFRKPQKVVSRDSSVVIYKLFEDEIVENAKSLLENFNSGEERFKGMKVKRKYKWWTSLAHSKLEKIGGPEFSAWTSEYVPAYRLQIDADKVKDAKFEGWRKSSANNLWLLADNGAYAVVVAIRRFTLIEVSISKIGVGLAEIFDLYYEDIYTMPNKELSCGVVANVTNLSNKKRRSSLMNVLSVTLVSGVFLISISALSQFCLPHRRKGQIYAQESSSLPSSEIHFAVNESLDAAKLQEFCISICKKLKDSFGWPGDIVTDKKIGARIGKIPNYFNSTVSSSMQKIDTDLKSSAQDIASYQVVLSTDGKIVGFQPTSGVGVNHWAANPLAKELYGGRNLSPGFIEPGLKISFPNEVILIELLVSVNSDAYFALARPVR